MKAIVLLVNFLPALAHISRGVAARAALPVLMNTHLIASQDALTLSATNLEQGLTIWIKAEVNEEGEVTVPAKLLHEFIASLSPGEIVLTGTDTSLTCESKRFRATIMGIPASEFPPLSEFPEEGELGLPASGLVSMVDEVSFAASSDEGRQVLTGILFEAQKDVLSLVATDGYRLSKTILPGVEVARPITSVIPARSMNELVRIFGDKKEETLKIAFTQNQLMLHAPSVTFSTRTIDGQFPPYQKIIPTQFTTRAVVDREYFLKAARVASVFAKDSANIIKVIIKPGDLEPLQLAANTTQIGDEVGRVEASVSGDAVEIAFNSRYMLDVLGAIRTSQVSLELSGPLSPGMFRPVGDEHALHIIMPVRTQTT